MKKKIALSLLAMFIGLLIYSCRKEFYTSEDIKPTERLSIKEARAFFKESGLKTKSTIANSSEGKVNDIKPFWHKAMEGSTSKKSFVEVPLQSQGLTFTLYSFDDNGTPTTPDKSLSEYAFKRLIMYKDNTGKIVSRILTYVPEKSFLEQNKMDGTIARIRNLRGYSGYIQVHSLANEPISIYKYLNGKLKVKVKLFQNVNKSASTSGVKTKGYVTVCAPVYQTICAGGEEDSPSAGEECVRTYMGENCVTYWVPDPTDPTDEPGENDNPPGTPTDPTAGIKKVTISSDARDCVSLISAIIESKAGQMHSCIGDIAGITNVVSSVAIGQLYASSTYNIEIGEAVIPSSTVTDANGNDITTIVNGKTNPITGNITLNANVLNSSTDLGVAGTMIHELMHSYFIYGIKHTTGNEKAFFQEMNQYLYDDQGYPITEQYEVAQHEQMAATYVNSMAAVLLAYAHERGIFQSPDSSISLETYCKDIMWRNLSVSQSRITAPNATRAKANGEREANNQFGTNKKGC